MENPLKTLLDKNSKDYTPQFSVTVANEFVIRVLSLIHI